MDAIGDVKLWAGAYEPPGWTFCDGKILSTREFPELYSIIGSRFNYGSDIFKEYLFRVPNLDPITQFDTRGGLVRFIICYDGYMPSSSKRSVGNALVQALNSGDSLLKPNVEILDSTFVDPQKPAKFKNRTEFDSEGNPTTGG